MHSDAHESRTKFKSNLQNQDPSRLPKARKNFIVELDGCVCTPLRHRKKLLPVHALRAKVVPSARNWLNRRYDGGDLICFFTTRPEGLRKSTETWLKKHGFRYHCLLMGKPSAIKYHYIDDRRVQATTFMGKFTPLIIKEQQIEVFG